MTYISFFMQQLHIIQAKINKSNNYISETHKNVFINQKFFI
jgi:hypothetical protein